MDINKSFFGMGSYVIPTVIEVLMSNGDITEVGLKGGDQYQRKIAVEHIQRLLENIGPLHCRYVRQFFGGWFEAISGGDELEKEQGYLSDCNEREQRPLCNISRNIT